jgi:ferredoxin
MENMITIKVIDREAKPHEVEAPTDMSLSLMELLRMSEFPVEGTCGGMALCASCQVYILSNHVPLERGESEQAMLDEAWNVKDNSRLGCQIPITAALNGLVVEIAPAAAENSFSDDDDW